MDKTVLAYIKVNDSYLMIHKFKDDINHDKYMGVGGHIEPHENKIEALFREIKEETNFDVIHYLEKGTIYFHNDDYDEVMYLFLVDQISGSLGQCDEGELQFIPIKDIYSLNMWEGDKYFLPLLEKSDEPYFIFDLFYKGSRLIDVKRR